VADLGVPGVHGRRVLGETETIGMKAVCSQARQCRSGTTASATDVAYYELCP
jgi:hypothetical protein